MEKTDENKTKIKKQEENKKIWKQITKGNGLKKNRKKMSKKEKED